MAANWHFSANSLTSGIFQWQLTTKIITYQLAGWHFSGLFSSEILSKALIFLKLVIIHTALHCAGYFRPFFIQFPNYLQFSISAHSTKS